MKSNNMLQLIIALCFIACVIGTNPNKRPAPTGITWSNAVLECGDSGLENEDAVIKMSNIPVGQKFWIGTATYKSLTNWMEFIGCYIIHPVDTKIYNVYSLAHCKINCGAFQYLGYKPNDKTCVCLLYWKAYDAANIQQCNTGSLFNVYNDFNRTLINRNGNGNCVLLSCLKGWEVITSQFTQHSCNTTSNVVVKCDNTSDVIFNKNYTFSKEFCLQRNKLLLSSSYCTQTYNPSIGINAWTNIFREEFEVNLTKHDATSQLIICFSGTLHANNGKTELVTRKEDCSQNLYWFLCKSNDSSFDTTYSSPKSTVISRLSSTLSFSRTRGILVDVITTSSQPPLVNYTTMAGRKQEAIGNPSSEFPLGAVIGGVLTVLVVVALMSLLILCKVRSCGIFKASNIKEKDEIFSKATYDDSNITVATNSVTTTSSPTYGLAYPVQSNSNTYAVVNKIKTTESSSNDVDDTYTDSSYREYDRLNDVHNRQIQTQENLYDSNGGRRNENDPTYDSSDIGGRKRYNHVNDNDMYDHSFTSTNNGEYNCFSDLNIAKSKDNVIYDKAN